MNFCLCTFSCLSTNFVNLLKKIAYLISFFGFFFVNCNAFFSSHVKCCEAPLRLFVKLYHFTTKRLLKKNNNKAVS